MAHKKEGEPAGSSRELAKNDNGNREQDSAPPGVFQALAREHFPSGRAVGSGSPPRPPAARPVLSPGGARPEEAPPPGRPRAPRLSLTAGEWARLALASVLRAFLPLVGVRDGHALLGALSERLGIGGLIRECMIESEALFDEEAFLEGAALARESGRLESVTCWFPPTEVEGLAQALATFAPALELDRQASAGTRRTGAA